MTQSFFEDEEDGPGGTSILKYAANGDAYWVNTRTLVEVRAPTFDRPPAEEKPKGAPKAEGNVTRAELEAAEADFTVPGVAKVKLQDGSIATYRRNNDGTYDVSGTTPAPTTRYGNTASQDAAFNAITRATRGTYGATGGTADAGAGAALASAPVTVGTPPPTGGVVAPAPPQGGLSVVPGTLGTQNPQFLDRGVTLPTGKQANIGYGLSLQQNPDFSNLERLGGDVRGGVIVYPQMNTAGALGVRLPNDPVEAAGVELNVQQELAREINTAIAMGVDPVNARNAAAWSLRMRNSIYQTPEGTQYVPQGDYYTDRFGNVTVGRQFRGFPGTSQAPRNQVSFLGLSGENFDRGTPQGGVVVRRPAVLVDALTGMPMAELAMDGDPELMNVTPMNPMKRQMGGGRYPLGGRMDRNLNGVGEFDFGTDAYVDPSRERDYIDPSRDFNPEARFEAGGIGTYIPPFADDYGTNFDAQRQPVSSGGGADPPVAPAAPAAAGTPGWPSSLATAGNTASENALFSAQLDSARQQREESLALERVINRFPGLDYRYSAFGVQSPAQKLQRQQAIQQALRGLDIEAKAIAARAESGSAEGKALAAESYRQAVENLEALRALEEEERFRSAAMLPVARRQVEEPESDMKKFLDILRGIRAGQNN